MRLILLLPLLFAASAFADLYMWKDSTGTAHYTNLPDTIPKRYRGKVKVLAMPGEKKNEQPAAASGQSQSAPGPSALPMPPPPPAQPAVPATRTDKKSRRMRDD